MPEQITPTTAPVIMGQAASVAIERLILAHLEGSDPMPPGTTSRIA